MSVWGDFSNPERASKSSDAASSLLQRNAQRCWYQEAFAIPKLQEWYESLFGVAAKSIPGFAWPLGFCCLRLSTRRNVGRFLALASFASNLEPTMSSCRLPSPKI